MNVQERYSLSCNRYQAATHPFAARNLQHPRYLDPVAPFVNLPVRTSSPLQLTTLLRAWQLGSSRPISATFSRSILDVLLALPWLL